MRASLGAIAEKVASLADLEARARRRRRATQRTTVVVIDTDPLISTEAGGHWWDVAVPEVSTRKKSGRRARYETAKQQRIGDAHARLEAGAILPSCEERSD